MSKRRLSLTHNIAIHRPFYPTIPFPLCLSTIPGTNSLKSTLNAPCHLIFPNSATSPSRIALRNGSVSPSVSMSGSCNRRIFACDIGSVLSRKMSRRTCAYLSRISSGTRSFSTAVRASPSAPASRRPPVRPRPPKGLHTASVALGADLAWERGSWEERERKR